MREKIKQLNLRKLLINGFGVALIISAFSMMTVNPVFAQTDINTGGTNNIGNTNTSNLLSNLRTPSEAGLSELAIQRNATGSCDSTCDAMGGTAPASAMATAFMTQVMSCDAGYTGSKTQTRTQNQDGSFTSWVDADTSMCVCSSTYSYTTKSCALPQEGTYVQRTPWVCSGNVGSNGSPTVQSSSCYTPCVVPASENQTVSCPAGYTGTFSNQTRTASCPVISNPPVWSSWMQTSSDCVIPPPVPVYGYWAPYASFNDFVTYPLASGSTMYIGGTSNSPHPPGGTDINFPGTEHFGGDNYFLTITDSAGNYSGAIYRVGTVYYFSSY